MGVTYKAMDGSAAVRCELTASQLMLLKEADYIESICEDMVFYAADGMERNLAAADLAADEESRSGAFPWVLAPILLLIAAGGSLYWVQRRKKSAVENY